MRLLFVLALLAGGCGDDTTDQPGDMMASADDLSVARVDLAGTGDMTCVYRSFPGFSGVQTQLTYFSCACGCTLDLMESSGVNPMWGATKTTGSNFAPIFGVALGEDLLYSGNVALLGLYSAGPTAQFFLDGDFDMSIDYDLVSTPPGQSHLLMSVRDPGAVQSIQTFDIEREQLSDGSNYYATMLGGVPSNMVATTATHGTLRLVRTGFTYTSYGDGTMISTLIASQAPRVAVTVTATLNDCSNSDGGGASCGYQPRVHNLRLASGTLANLPN